LLLYRRQPIELSIKLVPRVLGLFLEREQDPTDLIVDQLLALGFQASQPGRPAVEPPTGPCGADPGAGLVQGLLEGQYLLSRLALALQQPSCLLLKASDPVLDLDYPGPATQH
jgi:hypothetical protein